MRLSWTRLAAVAAASLAWAGTAAAQNINFSNTATRVILLQTEDSDCDNPTPNTTAPPAISAPAAGCTVHANTVGALFNDPSNDYFGVLEKLPAASAWRITVPRNIYGQVIQAALPAGGILNSNTTLQMDFNTATGAVTPTVGGLYYSATATVTIGVTLQGEVTGPDAPYFGSAGAPLGSPPGVLGLPLTFSCLGTTLFGGASAYGPFVTPAPPICDPMVNYTSQPGFAGSALTAFVRAKTLLGAGPTLASAPVWAPFDWRLQETFNSDQASEGPNPLDVNGDAVWIPNDFDTDDDNDTILDVGSVACTGAGVAGNTAAVCCTGVGTGTCLADNCDFEPNVTQADAGGVNTNTPDGIGNACQCGDVSGDGRVNSVDSVQYARGLAIPPVAPCAGGPGSCSTGAADRCNVGSTTACNSADLVVIRRNLLIPPVAPAIAQVCPAALP